MSKTNRSPQLASLRKFKPKLVGLSSSLKKSSGESNGKAHSATNGHVSPCSQLVESTCTKKSQDNGVADLARGLSVSSAETIDGTADDFEHFLKKHEKHNETINVNDSPPIKKPSKRTRVIASDESEGEEAITVNLKPKKARRISSSDSEAEGPWMSKRTLPITRAKTTQRKKKAESDDSYNPSEESYDEEDQYDQTPQITAEIQAQTVKEQLLALRMRRKGHLQSPGSSSNIEDKDSQINGRTDRVVIDKDDEDSLDTITHSQEELRKKRKREARQALKQKCTEFFNCASGQELEDLPRANEKISHIIMQLRPFIDYNDLIGKLESSTGVSTKLAENYRDFLDVRSNLNKLLTDCCGRSNDIRLAVEKVLKAGDLKHQPKILSKEMQLKPYQLVGLNWLAMMREQKLNAILADEMGLGKTIQVIAFLAHLKESEKANGMHLIVVPSSTIDNWYGEFRKWWPDSKVVNYYGKQEDRQQIRFDMLNSLKKNREADVLLTTYNMVASKSDDRGFLKKINIDYVVFDEAHMLKNATTKRYRSLFKIKSAHKILLTGTPLQNNLVELISLMHFVMPTLFSQREEDLGAVLNQFQNKNGQVADYEQNKIEEAKQIVTPFVLRRLKADVLSQLPAKRERIERCEMIKEQTDLYRSLIDEAREAEGSGALSGCGWLMKLRKAANHSLLHRTQYTDDKLSLMAARLKKDSSYKETNVQYIEEDLAILNDFEIHQLCGKHSCISKFRLNQEDLLKSGKFKHLDQLLPKFKATKEKVLLFSQFTMLMDILECYLDARGHRYLRLDGSTPVIERQYLIDEFQRDEDIGVFILSTRAGGLGINLTAANIIIMHDIDFNPYNDKQAEDRAHRVGQTKDVTVIKLLSKDTVEEGMYETQKLKLRLEQQVTKTVNATGEDAEDVDDEQTVETLLRTALSR